MSPQRKFSSESAETRSSYDAYGASSLPESPKSKLESRLVAAEALKPARLLEHFTFGVKQFFIPA